MRCRVPSWTQNTAKAYRILPVHNWARTWLPIPFHGLGRLYVPCVRERDLVDLSVLQLFNRD